MITTLSPKLAEQLTLDMAIDDARLARNDWKLATESNLHAMRDYVDPAQIIVWQPGDGKRGRKAASGDGFGVELTTPTSCTCHVFRLKERCQHTAFVRRIVEHSVPIGQDTPVKARDLNDSI